MVDPVDLPGMRKRFERLRSQTTFGGGGHGPTDGSDADRRVVALEKAVDKMDGKLDKIIETISDFRLGNEQRFGAAAEAGEKRFGSITEKLAAIEGKIDTKASAADLAEVKGRVNTLPSTWQMILLLAGILLSITGGVIAIVKFVLPHSP